MIYPTRYQMIILISLLVAFFGTVALAAGEEERVKETAPRSLMNLTPEQTLKLKPQDQEIRALLIREQEEIAGLTSSMEATKDQVEALELQREIGTRKQLTEIAIMEVQAKYAEAAGHLEKAETLRGVIQRMKDRLPQSPSNSGGGR